LLADSQIDVGSAARSLGSSQTSADTAAMSQPPRKRAGGTCCASSLVTTISRQSLASWLKSPHIYTILPVSRLMQRLSGKS